MGVKRNHLPGNLRRLREARGLTMEEVCTRLYIGLKSLETYEKDYNDRIAPATLAKLCELYQYFDIYKMIRVEIRFTFNPLPLHAKSKTACA